jgi:hypothetical protein
VLTVQAARPSQVLISDSELTSMTSHHYLTQTKRRKILLLVHRYPQITQTYIETERRELAKRYDVKVIAFNGANTATSLSYRATTARDCGTR